MKVTLKTLSPVHIGSGTELTPMDYYVDDKFHRINLNRLFDDPNFEPLKEKFIDMAGTQRYIGEQIPPELLLEHVSYKLAIRGNADDYLDSHQINIKEFIKSGGRIYIPGSSLKGAIFSALFWYVLRDASGGDRHKINQYITGKVSNYDYNDLMNLGFSKMITNFRGRSEREMRFARWLDVTDSHFKDPEDVLEVALVRIQGAKTGNEQPILYETLKVGTEFELNISSQNLKFKEDEVLKICNEFYERVKVEDGTENVQSTSNLLRLGQGSSAFATSLLILADDLNINRYNISPPLTRKRIDEHFAMGWIDINNQIN